MPDPRWMGPPEAVAAMFEAGPGPASVLASQLVWITEAISHELVAGLSTANAASTAAQWVGGGGVASSRGAFVLNAGLQTLLGWITHKITVTQAAAEAYMLAASTVVPSLVAQTNRDETAVLHATNFMGVNTPAIIERDAEYFGDYWPQNSGIGWSYSGVLTGLIGALGVPPPPAPMGASPAAPMVAGTSAAESAARTAAGSALESAEVAGGPAQAAASSDGITGEVGSFLQQGTPLLSSLTDPVKSFASMPTQALQSFSGAPQSLMGMFSSVRSTGALGADAALTGAVSEPLRAGAGAVASGGGSVGAVGSYPGAALTSYTRPASTFSAETGGRPTGRAGVLNAAELRGPTNAGMLGTAAPMPPAPAGMLGRTSGAGNRDEATRARIVVGPGNPDPPEGGFR